MNNAGRLLIVALGMAFLATCHQSILTAPPGSTLDMQANPEFIPANGGVSVITALVYDATGQPVADGTVVQFFTNLGRVDEQGRTNDGVARVNLVADGRSGTATVQGKIGGGAAPSSTTTTSSMTPAGSSGSILRLGASAGTNSVAASAGVSAFDGEVTVDIGTVLPGRLVLAADPRNIASDGPRFSTLTATVIDDDGNPVANIPVVFGLKTSNPGTFEETLESRGLPVYTDNGGRARDKVFTSHPRAGAAKTIVVEAQTVTGATIAGEVSIGVNY